MTTSMSSPQTPVNARGPISSKAPPMTRLTAAVVVMTALGGLADRDIATVTKEQWREDLRYFARELPKRHKNAFHFSPFARFERALAEVDAAIPTLDPHQIVVRLMEITAAIGDGHTGVHLPARFKRIDPAWADFKSRRDAVLDWILSNKN